MRRLQALLACLHRVQRWTISSALARVKVARNYNFGLRGQNAGFSRSSGEFGNFRIIQDTCLQCPHPVLCSVACPNGAIVADGKTRARRVDANTCTGCRLCLQACPWEMMIRRRAEGWQDNVLIRESGKAFLFSDLHMTRSYAEAAALGAAGDPRQSIAVTVRSESATYPRPTPVDRFYGRPFFLTSAEVAAAIDQLLADPDYADIRTTRASNGDFFLFSLNSLERALAESMAEWLAVGRYDNP